MFDLTNYELSSSKLSSEISPRNECLLFHNKKKCKVFRNLPRHDVWKSAYFHGQLIKRVSRALSTTGSGRACDSLHQSTHPLLSVWLEAQQN